MTLHLENAAAQVGQVYRSDWLLVDQSMIDRFAEVTDDHQFIHINPAAAAQTPFGGTVAHGFLTLSMLSRLHAAMPRPQNVRMGVNYGFDKVRFVTPVRSGSRIRAVTTIAAVEEKRPGQFQQRLQVTVEIEGAEKPALIATWLTLLFV